MKMDPILYRALDEQTRQRYDEMLKADEYEKEERRLKYWEKNREEDKATGLTLFKYGGLSTILGLLLYFAAGALPFTSEAVDALFIPAIILSGGLAFIFFFVGLLSLSHYP